MKVIQKINERIHYIGASDLKISLFENLFPLSSGVSYNAYLIVDEKTAVLDTVDQSVGDVFFEKLAVSLGEKPLDYLVIHHLEPDHSAMILELIRRYPSVTLVVNAQSQKMLKQFTDGELNCKMQVVQEGDVLNLGYHRLTFFMAPMVHWPEVMVSYDQTDRILFSADAFGTFGALCGNLFSDQLTLDESFYAEARRYYTNIVGKFGSSVQALLNKAKTLSIDMICPLHGPIWRNQWETFFHKYELWSTYEAESSDIVLIYASIYQHTYQAVCDLAALLAMRGVCNIKMYDVSKTDVSYLIAEIFRVKNIVLATPTSNGGLFPKMANLLEDMKALNVQNKTVAVIENGTWAPVASKKINDQLKEMKNMTVLNPQIKIRTVLKTEDKTQLEELADLLWQAYQK